MTSSYFKSHKLFLLVFLSVSSGGERETFPPVGEGGRFGGRPWAILKSFWGPFGTVWDMGIPSGQKVPQGVSQEGFQEGRKRVSKKHWIREPSSSGSGELSSRREHRFHCFIWVAFWIIFGPILGWFGAKKLREQGQRTLNGASSPCPYRDCSGGLQPVGQEAEGIKVGEAKMVVPGPEGIKVGEAKMVVPGPTQIQAQMAERMNSIQ